MTNENCAVHENRLETLERSDEDQWTQINQLRDKIGKLVPIWTTIVLMAMSAMTASALTFAGMMITFADKL